MRRCRSALTVLTLTLMTLLIVAPATAGGPTSVLLVDPTTGQTESLYTGEPDYDALALMVGAFEPGGAVGKVDRSGAGHESGAGITVTWLIHDVQVWRVDRIFVDAEGGPWISTQLDTDGEVIWHKPADGRSLMALLDRLVLSPGAVDGSGVEPNPAGVSPEATPPVEQVADTGMSTTAGLLLGLFLGLLLAMVGVFLSRVIRRRRGSAPAATHADPLDVQVLEADREVNWATAEELAR